MRIGAHIKSDGDPIAAAKARGADLVQFFLADPQGWTKPKPRPDAADIAASDVAVVIHSPYVVNLATTNNRIRIPSRGLVTAHAAAAKTVDALGLVVHGGHVGAGDDAAVGIDNWRKAFVNAEKDGGFGVPIFIENTAGGDNAIVRELDTDHLGRLWDTIGEFSPGFCLDICHAWAAGEDLLTVVDRVKAITGRIDLVHANNSRDPFGSGRDRHANIESGTIDPEVLVEVVRAAGAPTLVETPGGSTEHRRDIDYLRSHLS